MPDHRRRRLLIINFETDVEEPFLGFAVDWIKELAKISDEVLVITGRYGRADFPSNVTIRETGWRPDQNLRNVVRFYRQFLVALLSFRPRSAFTHMALVQGLLAAPFLRLLRVHHVLWFVHQRRSLLLRVGYRAFHCIITASNSTFPFSSKNVSVVGHAISAPRDVVTFQPGAPTSYVHWGRCDPIKRIDYLADQVRLFNSEEGVDRPLIVVGKPTSPSSENQWASLLELDGEFEVQVVRWEQARPLHQIQMLLTGSPVFLHACLSGLDKAPLEAALMGIPVLTENPSVAEALGYLKPPLPLLQQFRSFLELSSKDVADLVRLQSETVRSQHGLATLSARIEPFLYPESPK